MTTNTIGKSDQALINLHTKLRRVKELRDLVKQHLHHIHPSIIGFGMMIATEPMTVGDEEYSVEEIQWAGKLVLQDYLMEIMPPPRF